MVAVSRLAAERQHPAHPDPVDPRRPRRRRRPCCGAGGDDLGGTLLDGRVMPEAGIEHGLELPVTDAAPSPRACSGRSASAPPTTASRPTGARVTAMTRGRGRDRRRRVRRARHGDGAAPRGPRRLRHPRAGGIRRRHLARQHLSGRRVRRARRTCTASPTTRTRTGRARTRAATRSASYLERIVDARAARDRLRLRTAMLIGRLGCRRRGVAHRARRGARLTGDRRRERASCSRAGGSPSPSIPGIAGPRDLPRPAVPLVPLGPLRRPRRRPRRRRRHGGERRSSSCPNWRGRRRTSRCSSARRRGSCRAAAARTPTPTAPGSPRTPRRSSALRADLYAEGEARFASRSGDCRGIRRGARPSRSRTSNAQVSDPALRAALTPDYAFGCKRVLLSDDFYPAVASGAVTLERRALAAVEGSTLVAASGARHEVDALVLATGFASTRQPYAELVRGEGGVTLAEHWSRGHDVVRLHGGLRLPEHVRAERSERVARPLLLGAHDRGAGGVRRAHASSARRAGGVLRVRPRRRARPTPTRSRAAAASTPWMTGGCRNWYVDERSGRLTLLWPGTVDAFRARLARADGSEFESSEFEPSPTAPRYAHARRGRAERSIMTFPLRFGYKASAEQFGPNELLRVRRPRRGDGLRLGLRLRPPAAVAARGRPRSGIRALARRARRAHLAGPDRHLGADADVPLQPDRRRAGLRDARRDVPRSA